MKIDVSQVNHVHLIAICGTGMGSLAGMLQTQGLRVTGSDQNVYPPMSEQLAALGIDVMQGYRPEHLEPAPDLVVIGNAISKGNPEGDAAIARGIPYVSMTEALRLFFFHDRTTVAMCGTHGKTTSTALLAWLLTEAGRDPTYLVGGVMENTDSSYRVGSGDLAVVEGDEYDTAWFDKVPKFIRYRPDIAAVGNIEFDHADIYPDFDAVKSAFQQLIEQLPADGLLIAGVDCPNVRAMISLSASSVITYGLTQPADYSANLLAITENQMSFALNVEERTRRQFDCGLVGRHNLLNILGVIAVADRLGLNDDEIASGLASFKGIRRRQQELGEAGGILVIDDFAHHPTAVRVTLDSLKARRPNRRLVAVFEPRTNTSRRSFFQKQYAQSFGAADAVIVCEVMPKGGKMPEDKLDVALLVDKLVAGGILAWHASDYDATLTQVLDHIRQGDQVVFLSNGSFGNLPRRLFQSLREEA